MFKNLEFKLRVIGWIMFICGVIAGIVLAIPMFETEAIVGLLVIVFGFVAGWVGSFMTFAVAEILENTKAIRNGMNAAPVYATPAAPTVFTVNNDNRPEQRIQSEVKEEVLTVESFVRCALNKMHADGTLSYAKWNIKKLDDASKAELKEVMPFIENNDAEGLKKALMAFQKR